MEYVRPGASGLRVSKFCLGCMSYGSPASLLRKAGARDLQLEPDEVNFLEEFYQPHRVLGHS